MLIKKKMNERKQGSEFHIERGIQNYPTYFENETYRLNKMYTGASCQSPKSEIASLRSQRQNGSVIVIVRHEAPGAISSEKPFA